MTQTQQANPFNVSGATAFLGEIITWQLPPKTVVTHTALVQALQAAGLDPAAARTLCNRHAFVRACKRLAAKRIIRNLSEDRFHISFQFTREHLAGDRFDYQFDAKLTLDKGTGQITCTDPAVQGAVVDGLWDTLREYQEAIGKVTYSTRDKTLDRTYRLLRDAENKVWRYKEYLAGEAVKLVDHIAYLEKLLADREREVKAEKEAQLAQMGIAV
jgi:hypothetical protein